MRDEADALRLADLFEEDVLVTSSPLPGGTWTPHPQERALVSRAVPGRRTEFAAGRCLARKLMARVGVDPAPLLRLPDGRPSWPRSVVGSIAHARDCCVVAVAARRSTRAVGIDVEPDEPIEQDLWASICTPREERWLRRHPPGVRGRLVRMLFCAKEAAWKAASCFTDRLPGFCEVDVDLDVSAGLYLATVESAPLAFWGRLLVRSRWVFAGVSAQAGSRGDSGRPLPESFPPAPGVNACSNLSTASSSV